MPPTRVAVIGASFAKAAYLPALRHTPDTEVVAIASARLASAQGVAEAFGIPHATDDWRAMLAEHEPDLVCIATPTDTHAPMALAAIEVGAHVLSEKPMAMDAAEAEAMLRAAEAADRLHMIDHELRFNPNRRAIAELVSSGALGEIRHVVITNIGASWNDPASRPRGDWWSLAERGGGRLGANGSHQIDLLRWWFGEVKGVEGSVRTVVAERVGRDDGEPWRATADDLVRFSLEQERNPLADVFLSGVAAHTLGNHTQIHGSEGTILLSNDDEKLRVARIGGEFRDETRHDPNAELPGVNKGIWNVSVVSLMRELVAAIREGRPLAEGATFADGLATQRAMDAIRRSSDERRWIELDGEPDPRDLRDPLDLDDVFAHIDAHRDAWVADLQELVRQPSISAQGVGLDACAELVLEQMRRDGLDAELHDLDGGPPLVFGQMTTPASSKTMLCYSHYDVQPPEPIEAWTHGGPWSARVVDGVLYGRGATDNKSGVLAFNKAASAFLATRGELPVNLKFLIEGEEEIGSVHLGPWVEANPALLEADGMHCLDGSVDSATRLPDVDLGLKSVLFVELIARGAARDVHSLNFPLLPAPAWDLVHALASILDRDRRILVDGWYDGLYELQDEDEAQIRDKAARVDLDALKREWGIDAFALGRDGTDAIRARAYEPTANIAGMIGGYTGAGSKTIVPNEARVKMDFRLIPHLDPDRALRLLREHLAARGFDRIEVRSEARGEPPYKISVREPMAQAVIRAAEAVWGERPIVNGVSAEGTILKHVWIPCVLTGFANPGANLHAPDENIVVDDYIKGIKYAAAIMAEFGRDG